MKLQSRQKLVLVAGLVLIVCFAHVSARADTYTFTAQNNTGFPVFDFEINFTGTGGSVNNLKVIQGGGKPSLWDGTKVVGVGLASGYRVDWADPGLAANATSEVQFTANGPIAVSTDNNAVVWTNVNGKGGSAAANGKLAIVPEPGTLLLLVSGAIGSLWRRRDSGRV